MQEINENTIDLVTTVEELTYFYVKKQYKKYCRGKDIKYIFKEDLLEVIKTIVNEKFTDCKEYIVKKLEIEYTLNNSNRIEIDKIFIDLDNDRESLCEKLENIIDEFQNKRGFYDN